MVKITELMDSSQNTSESDSEEENMASLPMCQYGSSCYRKNPAHFKELRHPHKDSNGFPISRITSVDMKIEIGHKCVLLEEPNKEGDTHNWTVFVRGTDGTFIENFIEKVWFYMPNKSAFSPIVVTEPPFSVMKSGCQSFTITVELVFKNGGPESKTYKLNHDVPLNPNCSLENTKQVRLTFSNPSTEFRQQLMRAGASVTVGQPSTSEPSTSKRKREDGIIAAVENDECDTFGTLCATKLRKVNTFCPTQKVIAEKLICDVLYHAQMQSLTTQSAVTLCNTKSELNIKTEPIVAVKEESMDDVIILEPDQIKNESKEDEVSSVNGPIE